MATKNPLINSLHAHLAGHETRCHLSHRPEFGAHRLAYACLVQALDDLTAQPERDLCEYCWFVTAVGVASSQMLRALLQGEVTGTELVRRCSALCVRWAHRALHSLRKRGLVTTLDGSIQTASLFALTSRGVKVTLALQSLTPRTIRQCVHRWWFDDAATLDDGLTLAKIAAGFATPIEELRAVAQVVVDRRMEAA